MVDHCAYLESYDRGAITQRHLVDWLLGELTPENAATILADLPPGVLTALVASAERCAAPGTSITFGDLSEPRADVREIIAAWLKSQGW